MTDERFASLFAIVRTVQEHAPMVVLRAAIRAHMKNFPGDATLHPDLRTILFHIIEQPYEVKE